MTFCFLAHAPSEGWRKGSLGENPGPLGVCLSVELLDAVSQAAQKYEALFMGTLPVTKAMGEDRVVWSGRAAEGTGTVVT